MDDLATLQDKTPAGEFISKPFEQRWASKTPGMAAGLTDHVWTFRELLTVKLAVVVLFISP